MTYEEIKKELNGLRFKKQLLKKREAQIRQAREQIDCLKATDYGKVSVQGGEKTFVAEIFVEHMERLQAGYESLLKEVCALENSLSDRLRGLSETEQCMLIDRFVLGKQWKTIQKEYHYEERQPYEIIRKAIEKMSAPQSPQ